MKHRILWINLALALVLIAVAAGAYALLFRPETAEPTGRTVAVQQGSVSETITASGTVTTSGTTDVAFTTGGVVKRVRVAAGDGVDAGQVLVTLDDSSAQQALTQARSSYVQAVNGAAKSTFSIEQAQAGVREAEASVARAERNATINKTTYEQAVTSARTKLADAQSSWSDACLDAQASCPNTEAWAQLRAAEADAASARTAYDQAVQSATSTQTTNQIKLSQAQVNVQNAQAKQSGDCNTYGSDSTQCSSAVSALRTAQQQYELQSDTNRNADIQAQQGLVNADAKVTQANIALRKLQSSLQQTAATSVTSAQQALDSALQSQRKGMESDKQAIQNARDAVTSAREALASARLAVTPVTTGATAVTADQAAIAVASAGVDAARQGIDDTRLTAPVPGTVSSVSVSKGDVVQAGTTVATLLPDAPYEVTASFSEADAAKLQVGQPASVTFDAMPSATATGTVTSVSIQPTDSSSSTGSASSGVTSYEATITLDAAPDGLLEGMSASVVVTVNEATGVLWLPTAALTTAGGQSTVTVRENGVDTVVTVTTGLAGDTGTEITSGLSAGQQVVIASTGTGTGFGGFPIGGIPGSGPGGGAGRALTGGGP